MQDRFKFRLFDKSISEMVYDVCVGTGCYDLLYADTSCGQINYTGDKLKDIVLMQCTGLKDKNGKLVYEGDILGGLYDDLYIGYCEDCKQFQLIASDYGCMACSGDVHWIELVEDNKNFEVIGNIYETPELLSEVEE